METTQAPELAPEETFPESLWGHMGSSKKQSLVCEASEMLKLMIVLSQFPVLINRDFQHRTLYLAKCQLRIIMKIFSKKMLSH